MLSRTEQNSFVHTPVKASGTNKSTAFFWPCRSLSLKSFILLVFKAKSGAFCPTWTLIGLPPLRYGLHFPQSQRSLQSLRHFLPPLRHPLFPPKAQGSQLAHQGQR